MDAATRLLRLLALLQSRPVWPGDLLAERLGVTPRTVRRDVSRLRDLDYPVEAVTGPHGGYRMGRGDEVPPLTLDDQEALAVALGLRMATHATDGLENAAASALAKLERVLPDRLADQLRDVRDATVTEPGYRPVSTDPEQLLVLAQACRRRERTRFFYVARDGARSLRHVEPSRLVHEARRWYLVAFDLDRDDWRTFRVDRLLSAVATGERCDERPAPDALSLVREGRRVLAYPIEVIVRLHVPLEQAREFLPTFAGVLESDAGDTTRWRFGGDDVGELARWIAIVPCAVEVLDPPEVRTAFADHLAVLTGGLAGA